MYRCTGVSAYMHTYIYTYISVLMCLYKPRMKASMCMCIYAYMHTCGSFHLYPFVDIEFQDVALEFNRSYMKRTASKSKQQLLRNGGVLLKYSR